MPRTMHIPVAGGKGGVEKGDRVPGRLVAKADKLADAANEAALAAASRGSRTDMPAFEVTPEQARDVFDLVAERIMAER